jgi:peroxiredoxin
MIRTILSLGLILLSSFALAETAAEIGKRFASEKAKALEAYVAANAKAPDVAEAQAQLAACYDELGDTSKHLASLTEAYKAMPKGAAGDLRGAAMNLVARTKLITDKKVAKAAIDEVVKDFAGHEQAQQAGKLFAQLVSKLELPGVGDVMAISFTATDGRKVDVAEMKGKVVLVDFWATWCGPCVAELPNVKKAFDAHHAAGFEVVGVSLDEDKDAMEAFVKKEKMEWPQAFDGKGWKNELAEKFGIKSIPATFLIGKDGKVAATDLRGEALSAKVAELLK